MAVKRGVYDHLYHPSPRFIRYHEEDKDLSKNNIIDVPLPDMPEYHTMINYGMHPSKQKFNRPEIPAKLKELNRKRYKDVEDYWIEIQTHKDYYRDEFPFIDEDFKRREEGVWILINGYATYVPAWHYFFLTSYTVGPTRGVYFEYRDRDRRWFLFAEFCDFDPACWGFNYPKHRREGATSRVASIILNLATCPSLKQLLNNALKHGIQSKDGDSAENVFLKHIVPQYKNLHFWQIPRNSNTSSPKAELNFGPLSTKKSKEDTGVEENGYLNTIIDHRASGELLYDGEKLRVHMGDETGKCLGWDTPVMLKSGKIKKVQDVVKGDILMGDDSKGRVVKSITQGRETMYKIIPKKGMEWTCNESHILSLKWCSQRSFKGIKKDQTINISVKDYLSLSERAKKHLMLYRVGVEYTEKKNDIPPYLLGLWLGDGNSRDTGISAIEQEIISYIKGYAADNSLHVAHTYKDEGSQIWRVTTRQLSSKNNTFLNALNRLKLIKNKHIPEEYLCDSRKNRLELLAGLIDTDGSKGKSGFEITQKNKLLAEQICNLANSLGFYASINEKTATLKRVGKELYTCQVYRVSIYGSDLSTVPCKVKRKRFVKEKKHINARNPLRSGFSVENIGVGDYYGFTIDKNHLFLLGDYTVTHNTKESNVEKRASTVRLCCSEGNEIIGLIINPSTVGEMDKEGGANYKELCQNSMFKEKDENGQTLSGLYNLFMPAYDGLQGFIGPFGESIIDTPTAEQAAYMEQKNPEVYKHMQRLYRQKHGTLDGFSPIGAKEYLANRRAALLAKGKTEALSKEKRQHPTSWRECWTTQVDDTCPFDLWIIESRLEEFAIGQNPFVQYGNFEWEGWDNNKWMPQDLPTLEDLVTGKTRVVWVPKDQENADWEISFLFDDPKDSNKFIYNHVYQCYEPANKNKFAAGGDPIKNKVKQRAVQKNKKSSFAAGSIYRKFDSSVDDINCPNPNDVNPKTGDTNWVTDRFCGLYLKKPKLKAMFGEAMLKACIYYGCAMFPEPNLPYLTEYFDETRGFAEYLQYKIDTKTKREKFGEFTHNNDRVQIEIYGEWADYISKNGMREVHPTYLEQAKDVGPDGMTDNDAFASGGYCLLNVKQSRLYKLDEPKKAATGLGADDIYDFFNVNSN